MPEIKEKISELLKNEVVSRHSYFQLKYFLIGKEPTNQAKMWQCLRELKARQEILNSVDLQLEEEKDPKKKAAIDVKFKALTDPYFKATADLMKPINDNLDQAIDWLEKTYVIEKSKTTKTSTDKSIGNKTVDFLANMYQYKRDQVRGKDPKAYDAFDAKYKLYDGEHDKF